MATIFPLSKMTTQNKRKLAALNRENCEDSSRRNVAQNSGAPRSQEDYITQVSEEIEGRVTKRLSKEFSRTEDRILGALARLDNFLMNPLLPGRSGTTPEPTRNASPNIQGTNEDGSQNDPHPEAGPSYGQTSRNVSLEEDHDRGKIDSHHFQSMENRFEFISITFYKFWFKMDGQYTPGSISWKTLRIKTVKSLISIDGH